VTDDLRTVVLEELRRIAPEAELDDLEDDDSLREELDLDSMDFLHFIQGLHGRTGIDVPELDYPKLDSLEGAVAYLRERS
jgi:acyl carrier protein